MPIAAISRNENVEALSVLRLSLEAGRGVQMSNDGLEDGRFAFMATARIVYQHN